MLTKSRIILSQQELLFSVSNFAAWSGQIVERYLEVAPVAVLEVRYSVSTLRFFGSRPSRPVKPSNPNQPQSKSSSRCPRVSVYPPDVLLPVVLPPLPVWAVAAVIEAIVKNNANTPVVRVLELKNFFIIMISFPLQASICVDINANIAILRRSGRDVCIRTYISEKHFLKSVRDFLKSGNVFCCKFSVVWHCRNYRRIK